MSFPYIEHVVLLQHARVTWAARPRWRGASIWRARQDGEPLAACAQLLEQAPRGRARFLDRATVLLGFPHVHYLMLPWQAGLYSEADWQGFAEAAFNQQADMDPQAWHVQVASSGFGQARLAVATPVELLQDVRALFKLSTLPLVACTPLLTTLAQRYWHRLPHDCVLAVPEPDALSCLYLRQGTASQVCGLQTRVGSSLHDNLFAADLLVEQHAADTLVVSNDPAQVQPPDRWLGPLHPWLQETPA